MTRIHRRSLVLLLAAGLIAAACDEGTPNTTTDVGADLPEVTPITTGAISGNVVFSDGEPAADATVTLSSGESATTDASGAFRFPDLDPGAYTLTATSGELEPVEATVDLSAATERVLLLTLTRSDVNAPPTITAVVVTPSVMPVGGEASASAVAADPDDDPLTYTWRATGGFTVTADDADPSTATVSAPSNGDASGTVSLTVDDGRGGSVTASADVATEDGNTAPIIEQITVVPETIQPGDLIALDADVYDPDGDPLTYTWELSSDTWSIAAEGSSAALSAPDALGDEVEVTLTVNDDTNGQASATLTLATPSCPEGLIDCDADASNGCEDPASGLGSSCLADSCASILELGSDRGDGVYWINDGADGYAAFCDMTTDGGGWMLLGTISGGDDDNWAVETGIWANDSTLGAPEAPWDDYKSPAWSQRDVSNGQILFQRRYTDRTRGQVLLPNSCLAGASRFNTLFATYDPTIVCLPDEIRPIAGDDIGLTSSSYNELTGTSGIGGSDTNGFCWFGADTVSNTFKGHLLWNQSAYTTSCAEPGHLGGVGVWETGSGQYTVADITGTNWLYQVDYSRVAVSLFVRDRVTLTGDLSAASPGTWSDGTIAATCDDYRNPDAGPYEYGGSTGDGVYLIDPDGGGPIEPTAVFCDMTTDGGGWTAFAANGDNTVAETIEPDDCYPLISDQTDGCGDPTDLMSDFTLAGDVQGRISWQHLLGVAYGDTGYEEKLGHFAVDFRSPAQTREERVGGSPWTPAGLSTTEIRCTNSTGRIAHYTKACTHNADLDGVACDKGTIFGHNTTANMSSSARGSFGFTDTNDRDATASVFGLDDYQDGWSCSDSWQPRSARGARMVVLVR